MESFFHPQQTTLALQMYTLNELQLRSAPRGLNFWFHLQSKFNDFAPRLLPRARLLTSNKSFTILEEQENKKKELEEKE